MSSDRRFFWLKLQEDFFSSIRIKKLRKLAGGDTYTIIYLKMQLLSIRNGGILKYAGYEKSFAEELAIDLDEEPENVAVTLQYLLSCGLIETSDNIDYLLPFAALNTGSEGSGARRVREFRERQKALHCNDDVTQPLRLCNVEIEKEKEKDIELDLTKPACAETKTKRFVPPTAQDVAAYCAEKGYNIDAEYFVLYYEARGWMLGKQKMKSWRAAVATWVRNDNKRNGQETVSPKTEESRYDENGCLRVSY